MAGMSREHEKTPSCPHCGRNMMLAHVVPAVAGHPELRSYACRPCREAVTLEGAEARTG